MQRMALTGWSRYTLIQYLGLLTLIFISSSVAPALAQKSDTALIAQAQQAVKAKLLRERGGKASSVLFTQAKHYTLSKAQQSVRGTGVFRHDPQAPAQDFRFQVVFNIHKDRPPTITYVSYLITISSSVSE